MNLDRFLFWIRLVAWAILDLVHGLERPDEGEEEDAGDVIVPWFKPERIQVSLDILARAALKAVDHAGEPPAEEPVGANAALWPDFKPERIQFWIKLVAGFVLAVFAAVVPDGRSAAGEETGKSGERSGREADW